jgi:phospholipid/cholesterol/gamma-HCH transport system substrate-binding protein
MIKQTPSIGRIIAMVAFTLSCFGLLIWLWLSFGGPIPLKPEGYRFTASFREANMLIENADVRIAGLRVGKVKAKKADVKNNRTIVEMELQERYAPIPRDTRALLRIKALLGETYVELTPGTANGPKLKDGERLPETGIKEAVEIDEIISLFDEETRTNFQSWIRELAHAIDGRGEDLNDAIGNFPRFVASGEDVLEVLDEQEPVLHRFVRNTGRALEAINERRNQFQELVVNANNFFGALASRNESLADAIFIFPTFLDESKATLARLKRFARDTRPLVRDLKPVARDLRPTLRNVGELAPDLEALFRNLSPLIDESDDTLPSAARVIGGAEPLFEALHPYLKELNPVLSFLNYQQQTVADFIMNGGATLNAKLPPLNEEEGPRHYLRAYSANNSRGLGIQRTHPNYERGNSYPAPNYLTRGRPLGITESFDCKPTGLPGDGTKPENTEMGNLPPCFVQPPSLWDGTLFPKLKSGGAPIRSAPGPYDGTRSPTP